MAKAPRGLRRIADKALRSASNKIRNNSVSNAYRTFCYGRQNIGSVSPCVNIVWTDGLNLHSTGHDHPADRTVQTVTPADPFVFHLDTPAGQIQHVEFAAEEPAPASAPVATIWDGKRQFTRTLSLIRSSAGASTCNLRLDLSGIRLKRGATLTITLRARSMDSIRFLTVPAGQAQNSHLIFRDSQNKEFRGEEVLAYSIRSEDEHRLYESNCWLTPQDQDRLTPRPVFSNHPLQFRIALPAKAQHLSSAVYTYGRNNSGLLQISIETENGTALRTVTLPTDGLSDGKTVRLVDLEDLNARPGTPLIIKVGSNEPAENCVALPVTIVPEGRHSIQTRAVEYRRDRCFTASETPRSGRVIVVAPGLHGSSDILNIAGDLLEEVQPWLVDSAHVEKEWRALLNNRCVIFLSPSLNGVGVDKFEALCFALHRCGIPTIFFDATFEARQQLALSDELKSLAKDLDQRSLSCTYRCFVEGGITRCLDTVSQETFSLNSRLTTGDLDMLSERVRRRRGRSIDVVLTNSETGGFEVDLTGLLLAEGQELTLIPVGGPVRLAGGDGCANVVVGSPAASFADAVTQGHGEIVMIAEGNGSELGADISEHLFEHYFDDVDVVVRRRTFNAADTIIEGGLDRVSVKRETTCPALLDAARSLSSEPYASVRAGLELGLALFRRGGIVRQTQSERLLPAVTPLPAALINDLAEAGDVETRLALRRLAKQAGSLAAPAVARKALFRILTYRWHAPHQYELQRLPATFTMVSGVSGMPAFEQWPYSQRPKRPNVNVVPRADINPRDYDLALLHFDENILIPYLSGGNLPPSWGQSAQWLADTGLPLIALCHGTVPFVGQYGVAEGPIHQFEQIESARQQLVHWFEDLAAPVVCNSFQAQAEWGFKNSHVFWHGFDPLEFPRATLQNDVLVVGGKDRPHYRGFHEEEIVRRHLQPSVRVQGLPPILAALERRDGNPFAVRQFRSYVDRVRSFSFYLNTTLRSPMPRSRGEAMMTGVIPVCLRNHDVDRFIEQGVDGFYADDPVDLARFINEVHADRTRLRTMSEAARLKAFDVFNHDRNLASWIALIDTVIPT